MRKFFSTLSVVLLAYLLGFITRGVLVGNVPEDESDVASPDVAEPMAINKEPSPVAVPDSVPVAALEEAFPSLTPYDPENPLERLQALEKVHYTVPGSAFLRLVGNTFNENDHLSASVSALMELSLDESDRFNEMLDDTVAEMRAIEAESVYDRIEPNGDVTLVIPSFAEAGTDIRDQLLMNIESELGTDRRNIFEMMLLQKPSSFGNFGGKPMAVRNPRFETVNGWREIVTIDIGQIVDAGTVDERFEGVQKVYQLDAFEKRYGHFFEINPDPASE